MNVSNNWRASIMSTVLHTAIVVSFCQMAISGSEYMGWHTLTKFLYGKIALALYLAAICYALSVYVLSRQRIEYSQKGKIDAYGKNPRFLFSAGDAMHLVNISIMIIPATYCALKAAGVDIGQLFARFSVVLFSITAAVLAYFLKQRANVLRNLRSDADEPAELPEPPDVLKNIWVPFGKAYGTGEAIKADLIEMPHYLVAAPPRKGKSTTLQNIALSLIEQTRPDQLKIIFADPKRVEFVKYETCPHLGAPILVEPGHIIALVDWLLDEMSRRYTLMATLKVRDITTYNARQAKRDDPIMPFIVVIIDELAALMLSEKGKEVENTLTRVLQEARAAGIHVILATQNISADIITTKITGAVSCRGAHPVATYHQSLMIVNGRGAEKLPGPGHLLTTLPDHSDPLHVKIPKITDRVLASRLRSVRLCYQQPPQYLWQPDDLAAASSPGTVEPIGSDTDVLDWLAGMDTVSIRALASEFSLNNRQAVDKVKELIADGYLIKGKGNNPATVNHEMLPG